MQMQIPKVLMDVPQWVCWKLIDGRKVPITTSGKPASSTDAATWDTYANCLNSRNKLGFVFSDKDDFIGIDLDGCRDKATGLVEPWALEVVAKFGTYAEISPSQTGIKLFGKTKTKWAHKNKKSLGETHKGVEVYQRGRFFCVTGECFDLELSEVVDVSGQLEWFAEKFDLKVQETSWQKYERRAGSDKTVDRAAAYISKMPPSVSGQNGHDAAIKVAHVLINGFALDIDDARSVFMEFNGRCNPPWSDREVEHKLKSASNFKCERGWLAQVDHKEWASFAIPPIVAQKAPAKEQKSNVRIRTVEDATKEAVENLGMTGKELISLGIPQLDYAIEGGADKSEMIIIGARPSHGKSAIAMQMVHHMTQDFPVAVVSQEMSALALGKRTLQFVSDVPKPRWEYEKARIAKQVNMHFENRHEALILEGVANIVELCEQAIRLQEENGIKAIFIDYAQIVEGIGRSSYEKVSDVSSRLRKLATNSGLLVITLAQLSREIEKRPEFIPSCKDLKESGQLEQDADVVLFGVWPHKIDESRDRNHYQFFVGKNRNRSIVQRAFDVHFDPARQMYLPSQTIGQEFSTLASFS